MNCIAVRAMSKIGFADSNIGRRKFKRIGLKKIRIVKVSVKRMEIASIPVITIICYLCGEFFKLVIFKKKNNTNIFL